MSLGMLTFNNFLLVSKFLLFKPGFDLGFFFLSLPKKVERLSVIDDRGCRLESEFCDSFKCKFEHFIFYDKYLKNER